MKKPVFLARNADWISELPSVIKQYNNSFHHSFKMTPVQTSKKSKEKEVYFNLQDRRVGQQPKYNLGELVRTADIEKVLSKEDSINYSYILYTITEVIHVTIPSHRINYLPERYNENLLLPTKLSLEENNQDMKELNLIPQYNKYQMEITEEEIIQKIWQKLWTLESKHSSTIRLRIYLFFMWLQRN